MQCDQHLLGIPIGHHKWRRHVTATETQGIRASDQWGRPFDADHVVWHVQYTCDAWGATKDGGDCTCERDRGDACAPRLAFLARSARRS